MSIARISSGDNCIAVSTQSSTIRLPVDFHAKLSRDFHPKLSHPVVG